MPRSPPRTTRSFKILLILVTYIPAPVSSFPIIIQSHASISSYTDDKLVSGVSFTFALIIVLCITCVWITGRMNINLFISWVNRILAASISLVEEVAHQLSYFSFDTIFTVAASILVDANDTRRDYTRPIGGRANPASTITRFVSRRYRPPALGETEA